MPTSGFYRNIKAIKLLNNNVQCTYMFILIDGAPLPMNHIRISSITFLNFILYHSSPYKKNMCSSMYTLCCSTLIDRRLNDNDLDWDCFLYRLIGDFNWHSRYNLLYCRHYWIVCDIKTTHVIFSSPIFGSVRSIWNIFFCFCSKRKQNVLRPRYNQF